MHDYETAPIPSAPLSWEHANQLAHEAWQVGKHRPIAVAFLRNTVGHFLFCESAKFPGAWGPIQGGVDFDDSEQRLTETVPEAAVRETFEEVGIPAIDLSVRRLTAVQALDTPDGHSSKRGFSHGKLYFLIDILYGGRGELQHNSDEVRTSAWLPRHATSSILQQKRAPKQKLLERHMALVRPHVAFMKVQ
jgi:8-oxo-dGTP pyrophosphatase MutT (NUDIX family)